MGNNYWAHLARHILLVTALLVGSATHAYADNPSMMKDFNFEKRSRNAIRPGDGRPHRHIPAWGKPFTPNGPSQDRKGLIKV